MFSLAGGRTKTPIYNGESSKSHKKHHRTSTSGEKQSRTEETNAKSKSLTKSRHPHQATSTNTKNASALTLPLARTSSASSSSSSSAPSVRSDSPSPPYQPNIGPACKCQGGQLSRCIPCVSSENYQIGYEQGLRDAIAYLEQQQARQKGEQRGRSRCRTVVRTPSLASVLEEADHHSD